MTQPKFLQNDYQTFKHIISGDIWAGGCSYIFLWYNANQMFTLVAHIMSHVHVMLILLPCCKQVQKCELLFALYLPIMFILFPMDFSLAFVCGESFLRGGE